MRSDHLSTVSRAINNSLEVDDNICRALYENSFDAGQSGKAQEINPEVKDISRTFDSSSEVDGNMDRASYGRSSEVNEIERVCNDLEVMKYRSGNECNAESVLYDNAKQERVSVVTRYSHNHRKNDMGGELAVTENAESSDGNHGQGGDMASKSTVEHDNVKQGRVLDTT